MFKLLKSQVTQLLPASACLEYTWQIRHIYLRQIKLTVTKYDFLHVYKLTAYLVSLAKILPLEKNTSFLVSKNCLGKQFT